MCLVFYISISFTVPNGTKIGVDYCAHFFFYFSFFLIHFAFLCAFMSMNCSVCATMRAFPTQELLNSWALYILQISLIAEHDCSTLLAL